jgi:hypothetical protein
LKHVEKENYTSDDTSLHWSSLDEDPESTEEQKYEESFKDPFQKSKSNIRRFSNRMNSGANEDNDSLKKIAFNKTSRTTY